MAELYSIPIAGPEGAWTKLNPTPVANGDVTVFAISPDSSRVVYNTDQQTDEVFELYSVPIAGGTATKLNGTLTSVKDVFSFAISADSSRVVYSADQETDEVVELFSVPLFRRRLPQAQSMPLVPNGGTYAFELSPNSARVVYAADQVADNIYGIWSVPIAGGASAQLNGTLVANGVVSQFVISPNSARVVYLADQQTDETFELYSVPSRRRRRDQAQPDAGGFGGRLLPLPHQPGQHPRGLSGRPADRRGFRSSGACRWPAEPPPASTPLWFGRRRLRPSRQPRQQPGGLSGRPADQRRRRASGACRSAAGQRRSSMRRSSPAGTSTTRSPPPTAAGSVYLADQAVNDSYELWECWPRSPAAPCSG